MAYERDCDYVLSAFNERDKGHFSYGDLRWELIKKGQEYSHKDLSAVLHILVNDGFIIEEENFKYFTFNSKGKAFIHTDSYVERSERWQLEKELKQKELTKLRWEVSKMGVTYYIAISGLAISLIGLIPESAWRELYAMLQQLFQ